MYCLFERHCYTYPHLGHLLVIMLGFFLPHVVMPDKTVIVNGIIKNNSLCPKMFYSWNLQIFTQVTTYRLEIPSYAIIYSW